MFQSQVDDVLYGADMDGSGSLADIMKSLEESKDFKGAAGLSSLRAAMETPEVRVDLNTQIDQTWAKPEKGDTPIEERVKIRRHVGKQPPECFSNAGLSGWMMKPARSGAQPGRDELWKPTTKMGKFFYAG